jgi:hypothetical protein
MSAPRTSPRVQSKLSQYQCTYHYADTDAKGLNRNVCDRKKGRNEEDRKQQDESAIFQELVLSPLLLVIASGGGRHWRSVKISQILMIKSVKFNPYCGPDTPSGEVTASVLSTLDFVNSLPSAISSQYWVLKFAA